MNMDEEPQMLSSGRNCAHSTVGLCSRCKLKEAFNLTDNEQTLSAPSLAAMHELQQKQQEQGMPPVVDLAEDAMDMEEEPEATNNGGERRIEPIPEQQPTSPPPVPTLTVQSQSWLLRLFESKMFNVTIAMQYLYNSKEPGVLTYLGW
jgi:hypothetical protein